MCFYINLINFTESKMKILTPHFEYDNGIYSLVELENYIEKYGEDPSKVEIKPKGDQNEDKGTNIWLVLYQKEKCLISGSRLLTEDDFDNILNINHLEKSQVDIKKTFLVLKGSIGYKGNGSITPFYKDGQRGAEIQFSQDDWNKLQRKFYVENNRVVYRD